MLVPDCIQGLGQPSHRIKPQLEQLLQLRRNAAISVYIVDKGILVRHFRIVAYSTVDLSPPFLQHDPYLLRTMEVLKIIKEKKTQFSELQIISIFYVKNSDAGIDGTVNDWLHNIFRNVIRNDRKVI